MPRWATNTFCVIGIIFTGGITLIASLVLLFTATCGLALIGEMGGSFVVVLISSVGALAIGIWGTGWLARRISSSASDVLAVPAYAAGPLGLAAPVSPSTRVPRTSPSEPLRLTPVNQKAIDRLVWAMGAQIVVSILCWFLSQQYFWTAPSNLAPHNWMLLLAVPFLLYRVPYLILIYRFLTKPASRTLTYALVVPAILAFQAVFDLGLVSYVYVHHPAGFLLLLLPWSIHILILILAWKAIRQIGLQPGASSLFRAALISFVYFFLLHVASPLVYLYVRR